MPASIYWQQWTIPKKSTEKVFSFLSKDEVEKLKQEEERKIATLTRENKHKLLTSSTSAATSTLTSSTHETTENILNNNIDADGNQFDVDDENERDNYFNDECNVNRNLIIDQHNRLHGEEDESNDMRWVFQLSFYLVWLKYLNVCCKPLI